MLSSDEKDSAPARHIIFIGIPPPYATHLYEKTTIITYRVRLSHHLHYKPTLIFDPTIAGTLSYTCVTLRI